MTVNTVENKLLLPANYIDTFIQSYVPLFNINVNEIFISISIWIWGYPEDEYLKEIESSVQNNIKDDNEYFMDMKKS